ncbi:MAG: efflux RND transporter periplasmic adaptor subunit [Pyramidobacter sp.]
MKRKNMHFILRLCLEMLLIAAAVRGLEEFRKYRTPQAEKEVIRPVRTVVLKDGSYDRIRRYFGAVQGSQRANLSFRVSGPLLELPAEKGFAVKQGDLLARIDPRDFRTKLEQAKGVLAQARAAYSDAVGNFKRYEELYRQKVIAEAAYDAYKTQLEVTRSAVQQAQTQVTAAADALRDTALLAPFDGIVVDRMVENYQNVLPKQPIVNFQNIDTLEIVFNMPDKDVLLVPVPDGESVRDILDRAGKNFKITAVFDAIPGHEFALKLKEFGVQADPSTRTYPVTAVMPQPDNFRVLPGMAVTVCVDYSGGVSDNSWEVPESAVLSDEDGGKWAWRYGDGRVSRVAVTVLGWHGGALKIQSPELRPGDIIVTAGVSFLSEGQAVRLMKAGDM